MIARLNVQPRKEQGTQTIFLTKSKSAWLTIDWLSEELNAYALEHYDVLFDLKPQERGRVVLYNEDIYCNRWHRSYMNTPQEIPQNSSYMYAGQTQRSDYALPRGFQPFLEYVGKEYNQVIANWYANGNDYIPAHSDCQRGMQANASIALLSLYKEGGETRKMKFTAKAIPGEFIYKSIYIDLPQGCILTMHGNTQDLFRHKIPKALDCLDSRISLSFRKFEK